MYIKAAQRQPLDVDYEVQSGLGILFNLSGQYGKAADCFRSALSVKPNVRAPLLVAFGIFFGDEIVGCEIME